jgi:outer membrane protein TolC
MEQQPEKNSITPRELPLVSEWFWMLRYSLILLGTCCTVAVLAVVFKSPSTLKAGANSQGSLLSPGAVQNVAPSPQIYLGNQVVPPVKQHSQMGIIQYPNSTVIKPKTSPDSTTPKTTINDQDFSRNYVENVFSKLSSPPGQNEPIPPAPSPSFSIFNPQLPVTLDQLFTDERATNPEPSATVTVPTPQELSQGAALLTQTNPKETQNQSVLSPPGIPLTLRNIVFLALENNTDIKNAYLERIAQREDLAVAESTFSPRITPNISVQIVRNQVGSNVSTTGDLGLSAGIAIKIPTGGNFTFAWGTSAPNLLNSLGYIPTGNTFGQNFQLSFTQPLLKGAGVKINQVPVAIAQLNEDGYIEDLKFTLINKITEAIKAYRNLLQAQEQLKIQEDSLRKAKDILEINLALIQAGRIAPVDRFQSEASVANQELSLSDAENQLESARLALVNLLNIDRNLKVVAVESLMAQPMLLDAEKLMQLALENRPDYVRSRLNQKIAELKLLQAEDNRRWNLDFNVNYGGNYNTVSPELTQVSAGLTLKHTLGDRVPERDFQRSRIDLLKAENSMENNRENLKVEVKNQIREVEFNFRQVGAAQEARQLSEQNLAIAQEKLKLGKSTIFEIVSLQNSLLSARNRELTAIINYLNALTLLDQTLGSTLDTWQVRIERK